MTCGKCESMSKNIDIACLWESKNKFHVTIENGNEWLYSIEFKTDKIRDNWIKKNKLPSYHK